MFNYNIDIEHIIQQRLRSVKRTPKAIALLSSWAAGLKDLYIVFMVARSAAIKKAKIKGTKIYLERLLNETFGTTGIVIENQNPEALLYAGSSISDGYTPVYLNGSLAADDTTTGDVAYYSSLPDFQVQIPAADYAGVDQARLRSIMEEYIFSTINFNIVSI